MKLFYNENASLEPQTILGKVRLYCRKYCYWEVLSTFMKILFQHCRHWPPLHYCKRSSLFVRKWFFHGYWTFLQQLYSGGCDETGRDAVNTWSNLVARYFLCCTEPVLYTTISFSDASCCCSSSCTAPWNKRVKVQSSASIDFWYAALALVRLSYWLCRLFQLHVAYSAWLDCQWNGFRYGSKKPLCFSRFQNENVFFSLCWRQW